ncbi:nuclease [Acinetobacter phage Cato]|nr:nuclease [Acinetobacter phage Cato]
MRAAKIDANQNEIVAALRKIGCTVQILSSVGKGCPDILVGYRGRNFLLEIKDGDKPISAQKLTPDQVEWHDLWNGQVNVVNCAEQAIKIVTCN